jgi:hypothetical protein
MKTHKIYYHGLTIDSKDGKGAYWNARQESKKQLLSHVNRYCKRNAHLIIYKAKDGGTLEFVEHVSNI